MMTELISKQNPKICSEEIFTKLNMLSKETDYNGVLAYSKIEAGDDDDESVCSTQASKENSKGTKKIEETTNEIQAD